MVVGASAGAGDTATGARAADAVGRPPHDDGPRRAAVLIYRDRATVRVYKLPRCPRDGRRITAVYFAENARGHLRGIAHTNIHVYLHRDGVRARKRNEVTAKTSAVTGFRPELFGRGRIFFFFYFCQKRSKLPKSDGLC